MAQLIAIHRSADNPDEYLRYYFDVHVPLAKKLPGLLKYTVSRGDIKSDESMPGALLIAVMEFPDRAGIEAALAGPEGRAALEDLPNFSKPGNVELLVFDSEVV